MKTRMLINGMLRYIPKVGSVSRLLTISWLPLILVGMIGSIGKLTCATTIVDRSTATATTNQLNNQLPANKRLVFFSEYTVRSTIESLHEELEDLKRDLMVDITSIYFHMKSDSTIGFRLNGLQSDTQVIDQSGQSTSVNASVAILFMAEEFADIAIRRYMIQRRLLAGLRVAFVKFLPLDTLKRLHERFSSYSWLRNQNQVDLRASFPGAKENQYVQLYNLLQLRARVRAADDVLALTSNNMRMILNTIQVSLIEQKLLIDNENLSIISRHSSILLQFYLEKIILHQRELHSEFEMFMLQAEELGKIIGGPRRLLEFIDRTIDVEALDIDLSQEVTSLDLPPTVNIQMIKENLVNLVPREILDSIDEDRVVLMRHKRVMKQLLKLDHRWEDEDILDWSQAVSRQISSLKFK